jgi:hypothetical protein
LSKLIVEYKNKMEEIYWSIPKWVDRALGDWAKINEGKSGAVLELNSMIRFKNRP